MNDKSYVFFRRKMIINEKFIRFKLYIIVYECLNIGIGMGLSSNNNILVLNIILYISLFFSAIEQIMGTFSIKIYQSILGREFQNLQEFFIWEKTHLLIYFKLIIFYSKISIYFVLSFLTIKLFKDISDSLKIYLVQIMFQIFIIGTYYYVKFQVETVVLSENNVVNPIENEFKNLGKIEEECSICMDNNEKVWISLQCEHKFHEECIFTWIETNLSCPICRKQLGNNG